MQPWSGPEKTLNLKNNKHTGLKKTEWNCNQKSTCVYNIFSEIMYTIKRI